MFERAFQMELKNYATPTTIDYEQADQVEAQDNLIEETDIIEDTGESDTTTPTTVEDENGGLVIDTSDAEAVAPSFYNEGLKILAEADKMACKAALAASTVNQEPIVIAGNY